ncbi:T cell receptor alpha chain MC.7.G5-like [Mustelus asterias]
MGILLVFSLCVYLPRSFSQSVVQSPAAVTRKECQSLTITCVFYGGFYARALERAEFFRQTQAGTERERISGGGRFVESVNKAEKTFSLEIRDVRVEDAATYYCKAHYKGDVCTTWYEADGSGTVVTVTADSSSLVSKNPPLQTSAAGDTVALSCEYSGFCQYTVHWYSQSAGQALKYLLQTHTSGEENKENAAGGRISASIDSAEKISWLKISKLELSDSAVYYCALNDSFILTFGSGTQVTVVPSECEEREASLLSLLCAKRKSPNYPVSAFEAKGPVEPTLSVFYPPVPRGATGIDTAAVCLASDFSPNAIMLSLYTGSGQEANVTRPSVLLESGNYRSSGFLSFRQSEKSPNITCKAFHDNRNYSVNIPPTAEIDKPKCPTGRSDSLTESSDTENDRLRVNFLSLTVMGLRILFFKSIVFNVMMTARVWLF